MNPILLADTLSKETLIAIMMFYMGTKEMVCSLNGDTDVFDIVAGIFQEDTFPSFIFTYSINLIKENGLTLEKQEGNDMKKYKRS